MASVDVGDLVLCGDKSPKHAQLFEAIRTKIVSGMWRNRAQLPSTRALAEEMDLSRNTVISAYEQLVAEGYVESRRGAGYYVAVTLPERFIDAKVAPKLLNRAVKTAPLNGAFSPGVPDLEQFPNAKWQRFITLHSSRSSLLGNQSRQGYLPLRETLSDYLSSSRSVRCDPRRIVITSGAQQALSIALLATLERQDKVLMEQPGYAQMTKVIEILGYQLEPVEVIAGQGFDIQRVFNSDAKALYITPSNQYPMGTTLNTEQRLELIEWAKQRGSWIIEDDYDSEFQFAHRPYTSLQGLAANIGLDERVIYVGSFSKTLFNGLRLGYMVVPESLIEPCLALKNILSGDSPTHTQAALSDFIVEGEFLRHVRKMRRLYKHKHQAMLAAIKHEFGDDIDVISQAAGLHITLKWQQGIDERTWVELAAKQNIVLRPLSYYESSLAPARDWHGVVLGFGNAALSQIEPLMAQLAKIFYQHRT
ncbi:GntR family transcriptional regulator / MocR family aminotransferase [Vibrio xiamenensis]|uniref:GntR family transcriptional regulator / MocR family aminotransferase n=1 Tax=Vibrio xiamenensis TaxID=861298 RepID=A0A1G8ASC0_9VIBR|nr:GntR family transcriptional regulator / MocR family aminotransferase [Vibrio xiamenensis]